MLRATRSRLAPGFGVPHTAMTRPKYIDKPGYWSTTGGPPKDTLARRLDFYRMLLMHKLGRATAPFRTKKSVWAWKRLQTSVWKITVYSIVLLSVVMIGQVWLMVVFHSYQIGPSTPVLERKVREHRVSKQILSMVRERERDVQDSQLDAQASAVLAENKTQHKRV